MRKLFLVLTALFFTAPALADDMADVKAALKQNIKQETITLGDKRFLIIYGSKTPSDQYAFGIDLVVLDKDKVPHFEPLLIEEYDSSTNSPSLTEGVGFAAIDYHYNKADNTLEYLSHEPGSTQKERLKYQFANGIFVLKQVTIEEDGKAPDTLFKAAETDAKTH